MAIKLFFGNVKGGVGKTTITDMTAYILSTQYEQRVLVIDCDHQGDSTDFFCDYFNIDLGMEQGQEGSMFTIYDAIQDYAQNDNLFAIKKAIVPVTDHLSFIPANSLLEEFSTFLSRMKTTESIQGTTYIRNVLQAVEDDYDFILFDIPPSAGHLVTNVIIASDFYVGIMSTEKKAFRKLQPFFDMCNEHSMRAEKFLPDYTVADNLGVVMYFVTQNLQEEKYVADAAQDFFGQLIFDSKIRRADVVREHERMPETFFEDTEENQDFLRMFEEVTQELLIRMEALPEDTIRVATQEILMPLQAYFSEQQLFRLKEAIEEHGLQNIEKLRLRGYKSNDPRKTLQGHLIRLFLDCKDDDALFEQQFGQLMKWLAKTPSPYSISAMQRLIRKHRKALEIV